MSSSPIDDATEAFATGWYGYGHWAAPYWFVGMEPGGDESDADFRIWKDKGRPEFTDIRISEPYSSTDWFGSTSKTQSTWAKLIWLRLAYDGIDPTTDATLTYQRERLALPNGSEALIELSPFAAHDLSEASPRASGRADRIRTVREHLETEKPRFVVFYSTQYAQIWNEISGVTLVEGVPVLIGTTACVMTYHPQGKRDRAYWIEIARRLRELR